jgi:hypothetical protein
MVVHVTIVRTDLAWVGMVMGIDSLDRRGLQKNAKGSLSVFVVTFPVSAA